MPLPILRFLLVAALLAVSGGEQPAAGGDAYDPGMCRESFKCGESGDQVDVHYPFYLSNESKVIDGLANYCGYPGMAIICEGSVATLPLGRDSNYSILDIDYENHTFTLADADALSGEDCPRVRHNVTIPEYAWLNFSATGNDSITFFFDCAFTTAAPPPQGIIPIDCGSFKQGPAPSFLAPKPDVPGGDWWRVCEEVYVAPVLKDLLVRPEYLHQLGSGGYGEVLRRGFRLSWDPIARAGPCYECEVSNGQCSYDHDGGFLGCLCSDRQVRKPDCSAGHAVPPSEPQPDDAYFRYSNCTPTPYQCGPVKFNVDYPFSVSGVPRPDYCSVPEHRLVCANGTTLVIYMSSGGFQVTNVDYGNRILTVIDQSLAHETCPQRYRNTTIDDAMFMYTDRDQFLTVYVNCSARSSSLPLVYDVFSCFTGGRSYYTMDNGTLEPDVLGVCSSTLRVPYNSTMAGSLAAGNSSLGDAIRGGFAVGWKAGMGWCSECQASGGRCGYDSRSPADHTCYCRDGQAIGSCSSASDFSGPNVPLKRAIAIGASVAALVLFLLLLVMSFLYIRKRRQYKMTSSSRLLKYTAFGGTPRSRGSSDMEYGSVHNLQTHQFAYEELEEATEGFSDTRELGDGGFGTVYKGHLRDGRVVAVKRLYNNSCRHVEQFVNEAVILSRLRHPNLVTFYGCTSSRSRELLLVYEFVPNGTVADHLHGHRATERALAWPLRLDIAVETAAALAYLHAVEPPVVHRDVKTYNILLDANFHVKVADFGLSRLFPLDATHVSTAPQGTPGYVDPEYHQCYQLTDKSDVYSFGVVLVELISSKPAVDVTRDRSEINLAGMALNRIQRCQVDQLVDIELGYSSDEATRKTITMVAELAFRCLQQNGEMRPPIREVLDVLRGIQEGRLVAEKGGEKDGLIAPRSPNTVHVPWDSMSTTPSISQ